MNQPQAISPGDALLQLQEVMRIAASSSALPRIAAVHYLECREALLKSSLASLLPGFLWQCSSLALFHDFIRLYHPNVEARVALVDDAFARCRARLRPVATPAPRRTHDGFEAAEF